MVTASLPVARRESCYANPQRPALLPPPADEQSPTVNERRDNAETQRIPCIDSNVKPSFRNFHQPQARETRGRLEIDLNRAGPAESRLGLAAQAEASRS